MRRLCLSSISRRRWHWLLRKRQENPPTYAFPRAGQTRRGSLHPSAVWKSFRRIPEWRDQVPQVLPPSMTSRPQLFNPMGHRFARNENCGIVRIDGDHPSLGTKRITGHASVVSEPLMAQPWVLLDNGSDSDCTAPCVATGRQRWCYYFAARLSSPPRPQAAPGACPRRVVVRVSPAATSPFDYPEPEPGRGCVERAPRLIGFGGRITPVTDRGQDRRGRGR